VLSSFSKTINLATTGAGGMDVGAAPVSGYVALYAIYNPTTQTSALLATNATAAAQPNVYGGANMPAGYTASALVSVWPTNASSQFIVAYQTDRTLAFGLTLGANTTTQIGSVTSLSVSSIIPKNAKTCSGLMAVSSTNATNAATNVYSSSTSIGNQQAASSGATAGNLAASSPYNKLQIITAQTIYWLSVVGSGTFISGTVYINGYDF
jgi:hypothetical protein